LVATLADALEQARARVLPAWQAEGEWSERLRGSLVALLSFFDEQPVLARLLVVESWVGGDDVLEARSRVVSALGDAVAGGEEKVKKGAHVDRLTAEGAVGGVLSLLHARISTGAGEDRLIELTGPLMHMILLPYRGGVRARRELRRPSPTPPVVSVARPLFDTDPLKDAGVRLTYRTMRVLCVIADTPGASNRIVGTSAGIVDQGQISKLLARLERAGLLINASPSHPQSVANAWMLTQQGQRVVQRIRVYPQ
jgi:DNA-binding MarR family transcriptional regulator